MTAHERSFHLGAFIWGVGHHGAAWRHPDTDLKGFTDFNFYKQIAEKAEAAKFDMIFFADRLAISDRYENRFDATLTFIPPVRLEPVSLLGALGAVTEKIGLAATASTSYNEPFTLARKFASLDHLTEGRIAWNIVTSTNDGEALNHNREQHFEHSERYARAKEFLEVVTSLWDSWEDDAIVLDQETPLFADPKKVHYLDHEGEWFQVRGPLNIPRPPQGHPIKIQAGSSPTGRDFAAASADVIFTAQPTLEKAQDFYQDIQQRLIKAGRPQGSLKIMPGVMPIIGSTPQEAKEKADYLEQLVDPIAGLALLSDSMNHDLSQYPLDGPLPPLTEIRGNQSRFKLVQALAEKEQLTLRDLGKRFGGTRSHRLLIGTPEEIAVNLQTWFLSEAADGFNIMPPYLPGGFTEFTDEVVPILQDLGLFRQDYHGSTLRDHLGLAKPANKFLQQKTV
ncbi:LLM class flavin-dependent oxidoreductase [Halalkalibacter oceani]|uniref:LLM class flavin-dependent oxidoreductase n=1 Tax=Halalkalibacter oceani TaxID=1653776 RepID=A0A9X2DRL5_9BACI|nr:LLM class flavin-dependent oxidoreductase [Halalkalibacter oceani]MCM3715841.1 LLM class flavin-dependent oxidoreductase [Halalkalibacter oceani]